VTATASEKPKRKPWWLLAVAVLAIGGIVAAALAMTANEDGSNTSSGPSSGSIGDPEVRQAKWKFTLQRGPGKKFSNKQRASFAKQRKKLKAMTREVFDALYLSPEKQGAALRANFTPKARKSYQRAGVGVPRKAEEVRIRWRSARIVIDGNARATMDVRVIARGKAGQRAFATKHRSILYAARTNDGWKVFGFNVDQNPFRKNKSSDKEEDKKSRDKKKPAKKDKKRSGGRNRRGDRS
jgi:hypothetical protein